ncbi:hypothetical protein [Salinicola avicenniae]|uniref:hypothetical protein n=1 Tax=Salinicola avicenniae TaxID=2916836 RepID=UPI0020748280|nr:MULTISPECIES: hypothetical protein [unclassified Salinicola]
MNEALGWVRWWSQPWWQAHESWWPTSLQSLSPQRLAGLAEGYHQSIGVEFGIEPAMPERADEALQALVLSAPTRWQLTLALASTMCDPGRETGLTVAQHRWCERIARGLRPGHWLEPGGDVLMLLREWVSEPCWARLRLRFCRQRVASLEHQPRPGALHAGRLETFWQAAIWQSQDADR